MANQVTTGLYQHYKGNRYKVIGTGLNEADLVPVVIYRSATEGGSDDHFWVRPVESFLEMVETKNGSVPRFEKLSDDGTKNI